MAGNVVSVTIRVDEESKMLWRELADKEGRSLGGYLERVLTWMKDRELLMEASALDVIADRLVVISNRLEEITLQNSKKITKVKESRNERDREVLEQVLALDIPNSLSRDVWKNWVIRLRKRNNKLDVVTAQAILARWEKAEDNGYDLDELVELAIQRNYSDAVWDSQLERPKGGVGRSVADEQSRMFSECSNARSHAV